MPSKHCGKLPRCKNSWWCATDFRPSENSECFTAMTNYDRIKNKTPEELAVFASDLGCHPSASLKTCRGVGHCSECWLDWLIQEERE